MSDETDETKNDDEPDVERTPSGRKRRSDAGKPRGGSGRKHVSTRFERRASRAEETVRQLVELGKPDLDISDKSFVEIVHRDAKAWGRFLAQLGEWIVPFGAFVDLAFGQPFVILLNVVPSFRAARRDFAQARERRAAERSAEEEAELEDEELRRRIEAEHVRRVVEEPPEPDLTLGVDPRTAWQAGSGNGGT